MDKQLIRIASRNSPLALKQAELIQQQLLTHHPHVRVEIIPMSTEGDRNLSMPLATVGGKGLFVKELEQALLKGTADIAVHSMKDVPVELPDGLILHTVCKRDDARDVFVSNQFENFYTMPPGSIIGTASLRRQCLVKNIRPDLNVINLRGNLQTRLRKLDDGQFDAIILAAAGLKRLELSSRIKHHFYPEVFVPAVGQGIIGIECRAEDVAVQQLLQTLQDEASAICLAAERSLNHRLQGGCQVPIAAHAKINENTLMLRALVGKPDGSIVLRSSGISDLSQPEQLGIQVADTLLSHGADQILKETYAKFG